MPGFPIHLCEAQLGPEVAVFNLRSDGVPILILSTITTTRVYLLAKSMYKNTTT